MADIQYLNYGDLQIELLALLNNLADLVLGYVQSQPWSNKRKQRFMSAYSDIMNKGILGASNASGQWTLDIGGDAGAFDNLSDKDKEMYQEAAYFIQQQMAGLPTKKLEEEKNKKDLPIFSNQAFKEGLISHISNKDFGGQDFNIGGDNDMWNYRDERDDKGLRGRKNRSALLAQYLKEYSDSIQEGQYNFEGSPFTDLNDFKTRINNAITALNTPDEKDDLDALNKIGLNASEWFNNGSGDTFTAEDGNQYTYADYYGKVLPQLLKEKELQLELINKLKQLAAYNNTIFLGTKTSSKMSGRNPQELKEKYGDLNNLLAALQTYSQKGIRGLNADEISELHGAYRYLAKSPIDSKLLNSLKNSSSGLYKNSSPNRFKKIDGIDNFIYDTVANQVIELQNRDQHNANKNTPIDLFTNVKSLKDKLLEYLNNTEWTSADYEELAGIGLDIASIIDPEPWSAGGLGLAAAFSRNLAHAQEPGKWGLSDYAWLGLDYLTGVAGAIPILGDSALAYKAVKSIAKVGRKILAVPALADTLMNTPGAYNAVKKAINGEELNVEDFKNIGSFIRGLTGSLRTLTAGNLASRKALLQRGYKVSNRLDKKLGLTKSTPVGETTPTIKMSINGKVEEIPISAEVKKELEVELSKKGNDKAAKSKVVRENAKVLEAAEKIGIQVKDSKGKISEAWNNSELNLDWSLRNVRLFNNRLGLTPKWLRTSKESFGTSTKVEKGEDKFDSYLKNRSLWDKFIFGSNRSLRGMDKWNKANGYYAETKQATPKTSLNTQNNTPNDTLNTLNVLRFTPENRKNILKYLKEVKEILNPTKSRKAIKVDDKTGEANIEAIINGEKMSIKYNLKTNELIINNNSPVKVKDGFEVRLKVLNEILNRRNQARILSRQTKEANKFKIDIKELKKLKKYGFLKQGGSVNTQKILNYKNYIKK